MDMWWPNVPEGRHYITLAASFPWYSLFWSAIDEGPDHMWRINQEVKQLQTCSTWNYKPLSGEQEGKDSKILTNKKKVRVQSWNIQMLLLSIMRIKFYKNLDLMETNRAEDVTVA